MGIINYNTSIYFFLPEMFFFILILILIQSSLFVYNKMQKWGQFSYTQFIGYTGKLTQLILFIILFLLYFFPYTNNLLTFFLFDSYTLFFKQILCIFSIPCLYLFTRYLIQKQIIVFEYFILFLMSLLSAFLLISTAELSILFLCFELMALTNYILLCLPRTRLIVLEATIKYFFLGAASSGIFLLGIILLYGFTGCSTYDHLYKIFFFIENTKTFSMGFTINICLSLMFIYIGFIFKLAGAPFHIWSPDVYEGGPSVVILFFLTISKLTYLIIFLRFLSICNQYIFFLRFFFFLIIIISFIFGIYGALAQTKIKRFLAYSSIVHTGFFLLGVLSQTYEGFASILFYMFIYCLTNFILWALIIEARIEQKGQLIEIETFGHLSSIYQTNLATTFFLLIIFCSLIGLPPFAGFTSKFLILLALFNAKQYIIFSLALICSLITSFYYLRIIKISIFEQACKINNLILLSKTTSYLISICAILLIYLFIFPNKLFIFLKVICLTSLF